MPSDTVIGADGPGGYLFIAEPCPWPHHPDPRGEHSDRHLLEHILHVLHDTTKGERDIMATLDDINALVTQTGADAQAAADRVLAAIGAAVAGAQAQIADLQAQVQTLIDGNASDITPEQLQAVADGLTGIDATVQGIAPATTPEP